MLLICSSLFLPVCPYARCLLVFVVFLVGEYFSSHLVRGAIVAGTSLVPIGFKFLCPSLHSFLGNGSVPLLSS